MRENLEQNERRVDDLEAILGDQYQVSFDTPYGKCYVNRQSYGYTIHIPDEDNEPLIIFHISNSGDIMAETEESPYGGPTRLWKDEEKKVRLTPEDLIALFKA